jgi:hypothetical protein
MKDFIQRTQSSNRMKSTLEILAQARCQWLTPLILAIQKAEIRRILA